MTHVMVDLDLTEAPCDCDSTIDHGRPVVSCTCTRAYDSDEIAVRHADCPVHETGGYLLPQALRDTIERMQRATTPIVCHPDDAERMEAAVRQLPYAGLLPVKASSLVPPGTAYVISQDALTIEPDLASFGGIFAANKMTTNEP